MLFKILIIGIAIFVVSVVVILCNIKKGLTEVVFGLFKAFGLIVLYIALSSLMAALPKLVGAVDYTSKSVVLCLGEVFIGLVMIIIFRKKLKGKFKDFYENRKKYLPVAFKYWAVGFTVMIISNLVISYLVNGGVAPNEEANREIIKMYPIYSCLSVAIVGPICEELLFRLNFYGVLKRRKVYILFTGLLFGAAHLMVSESLLDLLYIVPYSSLGIAFAASVYDTDNIFSSITMHMMHNTLTLILLFSLL